MIINCKIINDGLEITVNKKDYKITYPKNIWKNCNRNLKNILVDNLTYIKTLSLALTKNNKILKYGISTPLLKSFFDTCAIKDMPRISEWEEYGFKVSTKDLVKNFLNADIKFKDYDINFLKEYNNDLKENSILSFSFGKDSLLSYGIASEIGLKPNVVFIKDMFDFEAKHKLEKIRKFEKEFKTKINTMCDETDKIFSGKFYINFVVTNALNGYFLMFLPFQNYFKSKYMIFGNQQNMNQYFYDKEGFKCYASYDQSSEWVLEQSKIAALVTNNKVRILSLIEPLHNMAEVKILKQRYADLFKYQVSCTLDYGYGRSSVWCHDCSKCAKFFMIYKALNIDVKEKGFKENMLSKEFLDLFPLFKGNDVQSYDKTKEARDEQLLAFYLAYKNKTTGYLIDKFKKEFLKEAVKREDELIKKYLIAHDPITMPLKIKNDVLSVYREELNKDI
jgi:hypothetical protein